MSAHQGLQQNRFELKYIIDEQRAREIRDYTRSYLRLDDFARADYEGAYPIHSVYLDGPSFPLANGTIDGLKNRFKLRVRYYDDNPASPVFFEIKRRVNDAIIKERAAVRREAAPRLLAGLWPQPTDLINPANPKQWQALQHFCELREGIDAHGCCIVSYLREAWITPENNFVRLTFDRNLVSTPFDGNLACGDLVNGRRLNVDGIILELKFTDRFPVWMRGMVHMFNLQRCSMPKYVECLQALPLEERSPVELSLGKLGAFIRKTRERRRQGARIEAVNPANFGLAL